MHSQLSLQGRLVEEPEKSITKKGKIWTRILVETELVREPRPGEIQTESVILPVNCFSAQGKLALSLHSGDEVLIGAHLHGTQFQAPDGLKRGVQIVADYLVVVSHEGANTPARYEASPVA
jgi:single-stranded DNA-binding protein